MRKRLVLLVPLVLGLLLHAGPAPADDHNKDYVVKMYSWPNPGSLTACFFDGERITHQSQDGTITEMEPLPHQLRGYFKTAANIWSDTPDIPIDIAVVDTCTSKTDIFVYGFRPTASTPTRSGCFNEHDSEDRVFTDRICRPGTGFLAMSITRSHPEPKWARPYTHFMMVGLGNVLGLYWPVNRPCENRCYGPLMSSGSCPDFNRCVVKLNPSDRAGIHELYYRSGSGGSGCLPVARFAGADGGAGPLDDLPGFIDYDDVVPPPPPVESWLEGQAPKIDYRLPGVPGVDPGTVTIPPVTIPPVTLPPVTIPTVTLPPVTVPDVGSLFSAQVQGQELDTREMADPVDLGLVPDPIAALADVLAVGDVDAYRTLEAAAATGWRTIEIVFDAVGVPSPVRC